jgi:hypothetical protein
MGKSYRIRTKVGSNENINILLEQDFEQLEILSLKIRQDDVYIRSCADYGVITGRVFCNGGFGVPNAKVSIFIPISNEDENNPLISTIYPYKTVSDVNEDGFKFNLLPYVPSYPGHVPTGTFPSRLDAINDQNVIELYDKYYKYTVTTNDSGDYMIFGVPVGTQTIVMNVDLSDIGQFSLSPQDIIRLGIGNESQIDGLNFKSSPNFNELPQIVVINKVIEVSPFWGQDDVCQIGITRSDFDLTNEANIEIQPTAVFMGSIFSSSDTKYLGKNCNIKNRQGNLCDLVTGPGEIVAIRQTVFKDSNGDPILEQHLLDNDGKVIDENGSFLVELPMNLEYVTTNEFGQQIISSDPKIGIPTKGKYRFKIKYQTDKNGTPILNGTSTAIKGTVNRANFIVPQIREYGWIDSITDPATKLIGITNYDLFQKSYAFSLDWNDYPDKNAAINCEDFFYEMAYNKVYTTAQLIDEYRQGGGRAKFLGIKEILDDTCETENNKFPVNDGVRNFDFLFFILNIFNTLFTRTIITLIPILHLIAILWPILKWVLFTVIGSLFGYLTYYFTAAVITSLATVPPDVADSILNGVLAAIFAGITVAYFVKITPLVPKFKFKGLSLPMLSYPECQTCSCDIDDLDDDEITDQLAVVGNESEFKIGNYTIYNRSNGSTIADLNSNTTWAGLVGDLGSTQPVGLDPDNYSGSQSKKQEKYNADLFGFRYALAGYPIGEEMGTPIVRNYSVSNNDNNNSYYLSKDVTLSQSLNLANLRSRYFTQENIIQTTVNNSTLPFTDSIMILLLDQNSTYQFSPGTLLSFVNPNDSTILNDPNITGGTLNQFGTNSITGTSVSTKLINQQYIKPDGTIGTSVFSVNSSITEQEYLYKTGIEYFQVITGLTTDSINNLITAGNSLLKNYLLDKNQSITYFNPDTNSLNTVNINPLKSIGADSWKNYDVLILTRGVDPYTEKQNIKYDLSKLFGYSLGSDTITVEGEYFLNIPIQANSGSGSWFNDYKTPESHIVSYTTSKIFYTPYNFNVSGSYTSVTTNSLSYYSSLDKSQALFKPDATALRVEYFTNPDGVQDGVNNQIFFDSLNNIRQGIIEGGTYMAASNLSSIGNISGLSARVYSPKYSTISTSIGGPAPKLVMRSDRLPTSDIVQDNNSNSFAFNLNDNFAIYVISQNGNSEVISLGNDDSNDNLEDFIQRMPQLANSVGSTFNCKGMVPLKCYKSTSTGIVVKTPCKDNENPVRVKEGCYKIIQKPYILNITKDIQNIIEWNSRFRFTFALCRDVVSFTFVNNWINGGLYMYSFQKDDVYPSNPNNTKYNSLPDYRYCKNNLVFHEQSNSFFYRATPYISGNTTFYGKEAPKNIFGDYFSASNTKLLGNPTTITDLGPKSDVIKQLNFAKEYLGYVVDAIPSTTYNDISDVVQLYVVSRLINTNFLEQLLKFNDGSINSLFSRQNYRIDGDLAQLISINSEFGVIPYFGANYADSNISYSEFNNKPTIGIFYSANTLDRDYLSPGRETFYDDRTNFISQKYGFRDQKVPYYYWNIENTAKIFGNEKNDWLIKNTQNGISSVKYQSVDRLFANSLSNPTFPSDIRKPSTEIPGYIYNSKFLGTEIVSNADLPNNFKQNILVGAPYHFYFGLKIGKTSMNKFITKYINNIEQL